MKKILLITFIFLTGCFSDLKTPKENIENISEQKIVAIKLSVKNVLKMAEQKYILESNKFINLENYYCISIEDLNVSKQFISGYACINNNETKAKDIIYNGYICNGDYNSLECEKND